jgi:hypothetical protein
MFDTPHDNMPTIEEYQKDIRAAEIRGATWALERTLIHNYIGQSTRDKDIAESATRIVDARRKEPEGFGPYGESK